MAGKQETLGRRGFLKAAGIAGGALLAGSCRGEIETVVNAVATEIDSAVTEVDSALRTAIAAQGTTETPSPSATQRPPDTETPPATEIQTATPTPEVLQYTPEGVSARNRTELASGRIEIDAAEGQRFYPEFLKTLLRTRLGENDTYFRRNFGITSPLSEGAGNQFLQELRSADYEMPEGLTLLRHCETRGVPYLATPGTVGAFKLDTLLVAVYGQEEYAENQLHAPEEERITQEEKLSADSLYTTVLGFLLRRLREGEPPRLMLLIALPNNLGMEEPLLSIGTHDQESVNGINRFLYFYYMHFLRNLRSVQLRRPREGCGTVYSLGDFSIYQYFGTPPDHPFDAITSPPPYIVFRFAGQ
jgi:hypothetical protein